MAVTLSVKSTTIDVSSETTDAEIATALNDSVTYTTIYGFSVIPISNTQARVIIIYA